MSTAANGTGAAHPATVVVENNVKALEAALIAARERQESSFYEEQVVRMEQKLERAKADVAAAEQSLADAKADLAAELERRAQAAAEAAAEPEPVN